jgi:hypothetical protein
MTLVAKVKIVTLVTDIGINVCTSSGKVPCYFCSILTKFGICPQISIISLISIFTPIRTLGVEFFHVDGRTDMTKHIVVFCNCFAKAPTKEGYDHLYVSCTQSVFLN